MIALGQKAGRFAIECVDDRDTMTHMEVANFRLTGDSPHEAHGFQLIAHEKASGRIQVEMRAKRWSPEPPTRAVYVQSARDLVGPLLSRYNRAHRTRHRLRIGARSKPFKFSPLTTTLLHRFTTLANTRGLHAFDWGRFYELVSEGRQEIPEHDLRAKLEQAGFSSEKGQRVGSALRAPLGIHAAALVLACSRRSRVKGRCLVFCAKAKISDLAAVRRSPPRTRAGTALDPSAAAPCPAECRIPNMSA